MKPYFETENGKLYHGDCLEILPDLEPVDLVLTDPPYGAGRDFANDNETPVVMLKNCFSALYEICNEDCFVVMDWARQRIFAVDEFRGDWDFLDLLAVTQENTMSFCRVGFDVFQIKCLLGKGKPKVAKRGWNLYKTSRVAKAAKFQHPTMKQVGVYHQVAFQFSKEHDTILDPFFGSGTTGVACEELGRKWIGIEISEKYCEIAARRIEKETQQLRLFA